MPWLGVVTLVTHSNKDFLDSRWGALEPPLRAVASRARPVAHDKQPQAPASALKT